LAGYVDALERLYGAVRTTIGSRVIVDTSKFPSYGYVLGMAPSVDVYVVHLVRDPRAVAYSWQRKRLQPDLKSSQYMLRRGPAESSLRWMARNLAVEALWRRSPERHLLLRYEDFVAEPQKTIGRVLKLVHEEDAPRPHVGEHEVELGMNHNVWGNPSRFQSGTVEIRPDAEWAHNLRPGDRRLVSSLTFSLLARYGYPLSVGGRDSAICANGGG
jgi:hypothetical protein